MIDDGNVSVTVWAPVFTATLLGVTALPFTDTLKSPAAGAVLLSVSLYVMTSEVPLTVAEESVGAMVSSVSESALEELLTLFDVSVTVVVKLFAPSAPKVLVVMST